MSQFDDPSGAAPSPDDEPDTGAARSPHDAGDLGDSAGAGAAGAGAGADAEPQGTCPVEPGGVWDVPPEPAVDSAVLAVPIPQEKLDRKVIVYWLLSGLMSWMFLATFLGGGAAVVYFKWPQAWPYVFPGVATLAGMLLVWVIISPSLAWVRWRFRVDSELLLARYGILFIEEKAIPISRLQHVDLYRGLLERFFGLTTLIVFTAGTEGAHFRLPGLAVDRARELRDVILAARGDDVI